MSSFKKTKITKDKKFINIVGLFLILTIFIFALFVIKNINFFNINNLVKNKTSTLQEDKITKKTDKNIVEKIDKNIVNILLIGRSGAGNEAPNLTDSIILVKIDLEKLYISMLSIPRDFYIDHSGKNGFSGKINSIYSSNISLGKSKKESIDILANSISEITGEKIDFYIDIDFKGFIDLIDIIGGIELKLEENIIDYKYPDGSGGYKTIIFKKGTWLFDGENALKYARTRHSSSDFDRSDRQQDILKAIRKKINGYFLLSSPLVVKKLIKLTKDNIYTNISLTETLRLVYNIGIKDYKVFKSNINDSCFWGDSSCKKGGLLISPLKEFYNGESVLILDNEYEFNSNDKFSLSKIYSNLSLNFPFIQEENYKINIFNSTKTNNLAYLLYLKLKRLGFVFGKENYLGNIDKNIEENTVYFNNIEKNSQTIEALKLVLKDFKFKNTDRAIYSKNNSNIEIVIGKLSKN